jgi:uncharacterized pyridoxamine 5'-phosphate oxidase family protein
MRIDSKAKRIIENNPVAFATVKSNKPYVIGVAYCKIVEGGKILITDNFMKSTVGNIIKNNNVAIIAWNKKWEGYQCLGRAKYYKKGKWLDYVKKMKENKGLPAKGAMLIQVKKVIKSK